ncbi:MAG: hypothetical protein AB1938_00545 [Myxococcota bacterium]
MSRQVALGGVIGFLVTVLFMAVCQKNEPAPPSPAATQRVDILGPAPLAPPPPPQRQVLPVAIPMKQPSAPLPSISRPLNLEGLDAGRR